MTVTAAPDCVHPVGAGVLAGLLLLRFVAVLAGDGVSYGLLRLFGTTDRPWPLAVLSSNLHVVAIDVLTLVLVAALLRREGRTLRDLLGPVGMAGTAWRTTVAFVALYVAFAVGAGVGGMLAGPAPAPAGPPLAVPLWFALWSLLVLPVTVAAAEEFLYRGYLQPRLAARIGVPTAVVVVAAAFALQHVGMAAVSVPAVVAKLVATFVAGLSLGLLYLWMRRLLPLILAHWALDVLGLGLPLLLASLAR